MQNQQFQSPKDKAKRLAVESRGVKPLRWTRPKRHFQEPALATFARRMGASAGTLNSYSDQFRDPKTRKFCSRLFAKWADARELARQKSQDAAAAARRGRTVTGSPASPSENPDAPPSASERKLAAQARKETALAEMREIELAETRRELLRAPAVKTAFDSIADLIVSNAVILQRSLSECARARVATLTDATTTNEIVRGVEEVAKTELDRFLADLRKETARADRELHRKGSLAALDEPEPDDAPEGGGEGEGGE